MRNGEEFCSGLESGKGCLALVKAVWEREQSHLDCVVLRKEQWSFRICFQDSVNIPDNDKEAFLETLPCILKS